eukprot:7969457-Pyramimonas_sp.AAC.1
MRAAPELPRDSPSDDSLALAPADWFYDRGRWGSEGRDVAAASWVVFDCDLRPSDVLAPMAADVTLPWPGGPDAIATLAPATGALPAKNRGLDASTVAGAHN